MPSRRAILAGPSFSSSFSRRTSAVSIVGFRPFVHPARLGGGDTLKLALAAQAGLELGEHAEHVEECLASGGRGVHRLLGRLQRHPLGLQLMHDVLQILHRPGQAIDAGDDQGVALAQEVEQDLQLAPPVAAGTGGLLGADDVAAGRLQRRALDGEILVDGADAGVAVEGHGRGGRRGFCLAGV